MSEFGITPEHLHTIADTWQHEGQTLTGLRFTPGLAPAFGCATLDGLLRCAEAAEQTSGRLGDELAALGRAVGRFNALTQESDAAAAAAIIGGGS
ncbi:MULTISPECIES: hypothetical protein [unclassified Gordonia (in: high G+C Gram-positive bacteria)]|uniref:hypothetical protein n=1 Tax=unclassified Gordonia (in: high G+C Gram-positive bacteria) TaxID=2657482 RepID=UPI001FFE4536|nr:MULTISPECIES: hypothetical protein [unclassified Gordonia (in: high G+C Gram-positive bacteria)]UQE75888.1 hypothetical protein MYK68_04580 [Gordonia sp. PP30]